MAGTQVPRDPNMSAEVRRFLDELSRRQETANIFYNLNATEATALLNVFTSALKGLVPASGGVATTYLNGAGAFTTPPDTTGGLTHLSRTALTSGTTVSVTGLASSKMLMLQFMHVSHNDGSSQFFRVAASVNNGSSYGTPIVITAAAFSSASEAHGMAFIGRADAGASHPITPGFLTGFGDEDTQSGAVNALQFSWAAGSFDNANAFVDIYGLN